MLSCFQFWTGPRGPAHTEALHWSDNQGKGNIQPETPVQPDRPWEAWHIAGEGYKKRFVHQTQLHALVSNNMRLLNFPALTWLSSHHILAPPFATLSERMKYSLQTVRRRMQVLANLAIVLIIPAGGREGNVTAVIAPYTPVSTGQGENLQSLQTQLVLLRKLLHISGRRKAPHATSSQERPAVLASPPLSFARESRPQPLSDALPPFSLPRHTHGWSGWGRRDPRF